MKNKVIMFAVCAFCVALGALLPLGVVNASGTPGSSSDPIVTKSYVDAKFAELLGIFNSGISQPDGSSASKDQIVAEVVARIADIYGGNLSGGGAAFTPVFLNAGEILIGREGTEIVLRSGKAVAYVLVENGLANLTTGQEMFNAQALSVNNLLIVPKYDARGVMATTDAWFIVKGEYDKF